MSSVGIGVGGRRLRMPDPWIDGYVGVWVLLLLVACGALLAYAILV
ncbi:hypothetical protein SEA_DEMSCULPINBOYZ_42 [Mycobacterium phage Demsculpinboyz]|uniref:Uncharacterized protein n=1 Tax=Mycobacterium phage Demsculpinboyz TaxID=2041528 RepID=A0A2D1GA81_9CAUD|nr:hypothetical protein I5I02_gp042 [Mycobacterium phage Demsculpinboyz]ATN88637.1 hypothetical protein SEA_DEMSCULPINBOYZ_42 [Mycobacterium phage Demsculpinboyz]